MKKKFAPIVLFVYNRPWHTEQTIETLKKNLLAIESELYIYSDEAKNDTAKENVDEVREYIKTIKGFKRIRIIEQDKNWGLSNSIINGVTEVVNQFEKIIVLEDDLVTSPYFLNYMNDALDCYNGEERVMSISAYMNSIDTNGLSETFLTYFTSCWGWGTWKQSWSKFERNPGKLVAEMNKKDIKRFNLNGAYNLWTQVISNHIGRIDTWAIFWYATVFKNNGLVLHPSKSMTINIGHDGSGIHCGDSDRFDTELNNKRITTFPVRIENDEVGVEEIRKYYLSTKPTLLKRVVKKFKNIIG